MRRKLCNMIVLLLWLFMLNGLVCVAAEPEQETEDAGSVSGDEAQEAEEEMQEDAAEPVQQGQTMQLGERLIPLNAVKLDLSGMNLKGYDMDGLLSQMPNLKKLTLIGCGLSNDGYAALQDAHPGVRMIWEIKYATRTLRTDAVGWSTFRGMHGPMDLPMTDADTKYLKYCRDLIIVDLGHNYIRDISFVQYMPNLQLFIAVDNGGLWDLSMLKYCPKLRYIEIFVNRVSDLSVFKYLHQLEDVNISYNPIRSNEYLKDLPELKKLWLEHTSIPEAEVKELRELYPQATIVNVGSGSVDQGWRWGKRYSSMRSLVWDNVTNDVYH